MKLKLKFDNVKLPLDYNKLTQYTRRLAREEYVRLQKGLCQYCKQPLTGMPSMKVRGAIINKSLFPPNFFKHPVHLHHDHQTGLTIGAVHNYCNAYLWQYHGE